jgi:hypothetical protein
MIFDSSGGYMIVVHVNKSWPWVEAERMDEAEAVLGAWPIAEDKLKAYGDVLLAVFNNVVVAAYDIEGHTRDEDNLVRRVTFTGKKSQTWAHLVGQPNPGTHWGRQGDRLLRPRRIRRARRPSRRAISASAGTKDASWSAHLFSPDRRRHASWECL